MASARKSVETSLDAADMSVRATQTWLVRDRRKRLAGELGMG
jgi:hypothetical protein